MLGDIVDVVGPLLGAALVVAVLRDVFHTLFHPGGHGSLSSVLGRATFTLARRLGRWATLVAGPTAVLLTTVAWLLLLVVGFAGLLLPLVPQDLAYGSGSPRGPALLDALYLSAISVSTLGLGDVVVQEPWLRWASPLEALLGFAVLTAAITWVTQIYPALGRRRALALDVWLATRGASQVAGHHGEQHGEHHDQDVLHAWARALVTVVVDLNQNHETWWFRESDERMSLGPALRTLDAVAETHLDTRGGRHLRRAVDLARETVHAQFGDSVRGSGRDRGQVQ